MCAHLLQLQSILAICGFNDGCGALLAKAAMQDADDNSTKGNSSRYYSHERMLPSSTGAAFLKIEKYTIKVRYFICTSPYGG